MWIEVLDEQAFLERAPEDGAVGDGGVEVGVPGVQVCVEVHQRDRTVFGMQRTQIRQCDGVIPADGHDSPVPTAEDVGGVVLDLGAGLGDVVRGHRHVTGIDHLYVFKGGHPEFDVVARAQCAGSRAHRQRTEACPRPV